MSPNLTLRPPFWWAVVPALLLGFAIFVTNLDRVSLWSDEGWTIAASAAHSPVDTVAEWVVPDVHPPLYFLALQGWRVFTGDSVFELRTFSVLVSLLGIAFTYQAGRRWFNPAAGLLGATFYALHDLIHVLTQEVRHYPGQMALVALVLWLYGRFFDRPTRTRGVAFVLAAAALMLTHYWGGFIVLALGVQALLTRLLPALRRPNMRGAAWRLMLAFFAVGLLFLPWLPALIHQITLERPNGLPHALENTNWVMRVLLYQLLGVPEVFWLVMMAAGTVGAFALAPRRWLPTPATLAVSLAAALPVLLSILINTGYPILSFRALAVVVPPAMLLAAHGLSRFGTTERAVVAIFIVLFSLTGRSAAPIDRPDWPTIAAVITLHADASDVILLENDTDEHALDYYIARTDRPVQAYHTDHVRDFTPEDYPAYLAQALDGVDGVWVAKLGWPGDPEDPTGDIRPTLSAEYGFQMSLPEHNYGMYNDRPILVWRLDRAPQPGEGIATFGDELRLIRAQTHIHPDGTLLVNLLWSPLVQPSQDYTVSIRLNGPDGPANVDARPQDGALTTTWAPGSLQFDSHALPDLPPGTYEVGVLLYYPTDPSFSSTEIAPADDCSDDPECRFIFFDTVTIPPAAG